MTGSGTADREDWRKYVEAAQRKIEIARYHLDRLGALKSGLSTPRSLVPIPAQAHFEGVVYATNAAADQLAGAVNLGLNLGLRRRYVNLGRVLERMEDSPLKEELHEWHKDDIAQDVRDIRNEAVHHHYAKDAQTFVVQDPRDADPYGGPRDLIGYATAAVEHAEALHPLLDELGRALSHQGE